MSRPILALGLLVSLGGCLPESARLALVPSDPAVARHTAARPPAGVAPANEELARRVGTVGQKLMAGNRCLDVRPRFSTVGLPNEELYHRGTDEVVISEGLVKHCQNDDQLAGLLALELGRAMTEREVLAGTTVSRPLPRLLPEDLRIGNDRSAAFGSPDGTRLMELAKIEKASRAAPVPAEPEGLARVYLRRAGFDDNNFKAVEELAKLADLNGKLGRPTASR